MPKTQSMNFSEHINKKILSKIQTKRLIGRTANLFTAQILCASLYRRVLNPFKFAVQR